MSAGPARAPWRRISDARPLVAWRDAQLAALAGAFQGLREAWSKDWGMAAQTAPEACVRVTSTLAQGCWQAAGTCSAGSAWIELPDAPHDAIACALWGSGAVTGPIAARVTSACLADLHARLHAMLRLDAGAAARTVAQACGPWSGLVVVDLGLGVRLLLEAAVVQRVLEDAAPEVARRPSAGSASAALIPLRTALEPQRIALTARLADCELDLASVQDLRVGDVVPLPHRLDAPLLVRDAQEEVLFAGYLARRAGHKALELAAAPAPVAPNPGKVPS